MRNLKQRSRGACLHDVTQACALRVSADVSEIGHFGLGVREVLPSLVDKRYYPSPKHGYANGPSLCAILDAFRIMESVIARRAG